MGKNSVPVRRPKKKHWTVNRELFTEKEFFWLQKRFAEIVPCNFCPTLPFGVANVKILLLDSWSQSASKMTWMMNVYETIQPSITAGPSSYITLHTLYIMVLSTYPNYISISRNNLQWKLHLYYCNHYIIYLLWYSNFIWLVVYLPPWKIRKSDWDDSSQLLGKIKVMFQTTSQLI